MHEHWCSDCEEFWDCDDGDDCMLAENTSCGCGEMV